MRRKKLLFLLKTFDLVSHDARCGGVGYEQIFHMVIFYLRFTRCMVHASN